MWIDYKNLCNEIQLGREVDLIVGGKPFYIGPHYESNGFIVYDEKESKQVFLGNFWELVNYKFCGKYSLYENYSDFFISYIM